MSEFTDHFMVTAVPEAPLLESRKWSLRNPLDFSHQMRSFPTPVTVQTGGAGGGRPSIGLVFPH